MKILIAGGGTAGHVNPALALARALDDDEVTFVGTKTGAEARLVPAAGFELALIDVRGFDRARPLSLLPVALVAGRAIVVAGRLLGSVRPAVVVGMGGYVSLPVCIAAATRRIPIVLHEQNIVLGLANRVCKRFARVIAVSFRETATRVGRRAVFVGNPVLPEIAKADLRRERERALARFDLESDRKTLLAFGGSQGARTVNDAAVTLRETWAKRADLQVLHIGGRGAGHESVGDRAGASLIYRRVEFVERMAEAYAVADLALCRGGATTVAELGAVGLPAIVVPYPHHRDHQQELHGRVLERAGAAVVVADADATVERIAKEAERLLSDDGSLQQMRRSAADFGRPDAAAELARVVRSAA
jgi:UDP-N-acetylglucosamine--N-acetylmuramyl-(pentapeptide) pyrophosphoryl-undecaprenol N-acetylglucosamine transferase